MEHFSKKRVGLFLVGGCAAVVIAAALSVMFGSTDVPLAKVWQTFTAPNLTDQEQIVVYELRIPRAIGCMLVGAAFATAGTTGGKILSGTKIFRKRRKKVSGAEKTGAGLCKRMGRKRIPGGYLPGRTVYGIERFC